MTLLEILDEMNREALAALDESLAKQNSLVTIFDGRYEQQRDQTERYLEVCRAITSQI